MKFKAFYCLFSFLFFFSLILRYPGLFYPESEQGFDSYDNHILADELIRNGYEFRLFTIFSLFGLDTFSNNLGGIFILGSFSLLTGLSTSYAILFITLILGILGFLTYFWFSSFFFTDKRLILLSTFLFNTTPLFLALTSWNYSFRGPFLAFLPLFYTLILRLYQRNNSFKMFMLLPLVGIALLTIHKMAFFIIFIVLSSLLIYLLVFFKITINYVNSIKSWKYQSIILLTFIVSSFITFNNSLYYKGGNQITLENLDFSYTSSQITAILVSYSFMFGFMILFTPLGLFKLIRSRANDERFQLIILILFFTLVWTDIIYAKTFSLIFLPILVIFGIKDIFNYKTYKKISSNLFFLIILFCIVSVQLIPSFVTFQSTNFKNIPEEDTMYNYERENILVENTGIYLKYTGNIPIIPTLVSGNKIVAFSQGYSVHQFYLPSGFSPEMFLLADVAAFLSGERDVIFDSPYSRDLKYYVLVNPRNHDDPLVRMSLSDLFKQDDEYLLVAYSPYPDLVNNPSTNEFEKSVFSSQVNENYYHFYCSDYHSIRYLKYD